MSMKALTAVAGAAGVSDDVTVTVTAVDGSDVKFDMVVADEPK